jgi:hypothetical protein
MPYLIRDVAEKDFRPSPERFSVLRLASSSEVLHPGKNMNTLASLRTPGSPLSRGLMNRTEIEGRQCLPSPPRGLMTSRKSKNLGFFSSPGFDNLSDS